MIKFLIKIGLLAVVGVLTYNYFFGTAAEKQQSANVFGMVKDLGSSIGDLVKSETEKFDQGKYDQVLSKVTSAFDALKSQDSQTGGGMSNELAQLEGEKSALQSLLAQATKGGAEKVSKQDVNKLYMDLQGLLGKIQNVSKEMEKKSGK